MTRREMTILQNKAEKAMKEAIRQLVREHMPSGEPLVVWKNGKVALVPATQQLLRKII